VPVFDNAQIREPREGVEPTTYCLQTGRDPVHLNPQDPSRAQWRGQPACFIHLHPPCSMDGGVSGASGWASKLLERPDSIQRSDDISVFQCGRVRRIPRTSEAAAIFTHRSDRLSIRHRSRREAPP